MGTVLITGHNGQTGRFLIEEFLSNSWDVHGVSSNAIENVHSESVIEHFLDIKESSLIGDLIKSIQPDVIVNLAAISSVSRSWESPLETSQINGFAVLEMLKLIENELPDCRFVQASSAEIFSQSFESPQNEKTAIRPSNPYGIAKAFAHNFVEIFRNTGANFSNCILYNHESIYRPHSFVSRKITSGVAQIATGAKEKIQLGNLQVKRDWGWAPDFAEALFLTSIAPEPNTFIVATGVSNSVEDFVIEAFKNVGILDWEDYVEIDQSLLRPSDSIELKGDASKIQRELGWTPTTPFSDIVRQMVVNDMNLELRKQ